MSQITPQLRLLHLRVLALQSVCTGYEPHQTAIRALCHMRITKLRGWENNINGLAYHYRRQISPELVPIRAAVVGWRREWPPMTAECGL